MIPPTLDGLPQGPAQTRYASLLDAALAVVPCDAAALLKLEGGDLLRPVAVHGLSEEALQRRFPLAAHPRLTTLMRGYGVHRFPADCGLPDPYDGLVEHPSAAADPLLPVHDCMGAPLRLGGRPWGVVTFDALEPGAFDAVDAAQLAAALQLLQRHLPDVEALERAAGEPSQQAFPPAATIVRPVRQLEGRSPAWLQLMREVDTVAASDLTVLILGETGVGKELVAQRLHEGSRRAQRPLVQVNCAALPETLADSELFGHRRGAFTGATQDRIGKFELASGGSLMLDEVGELPLSIQAKLLRVLQSGDIQRPGSDRPLRVDVRVMAATNRDLRAEVAAGRFRADLYHRLAVYPVHVPPLRARGRDVLALAGSFLEENQHRLGARNLRLSPASREVLQHYPWPGNVRELEHLISRAALRAWAEQRKGQRWTAIEPEHLGLPRALARQSVPAAAAAPMPTVSPPVDAMDLEAHALAAAHGAEAHAFSAAHTTDAPPQTLRAATDAFQRQWLQALLERHPGSVAAAAREAGMDRSNFHRLLKKLGLAANRP